MVLELVGYATFTGSGNILDIFEKSTLRCSEGRSSPFLAALFPFFVRDKKINGASFLPGIDSDRVSIFYKSKRASNLLSQNKKPTYLRTKIQTVSTVF